MARFLSFFLCSLAKPQHALTLSLLVFNTAPLDNTFVMDLDDPKKNWGYIFLHAKEKTTRGGEEAIDCIEMTLPHLSDLRDYKMTKATVVDEGRAILLEEPTVPLWFRLDYTKWFEQQKSPCSRTQFAHVLFASKIQRKENDYATRKTLIRLPEGLQCTGDQTVACKMENNEILKKDFRPWMLDTSIEAVDFSLHTFLPISWLVRLVSDERRDLKVDDDSSVGGMLSDFQGMKLNFGSP
jgi:hypothetical protein